jgi:hypothetical protein
VAVIQYSTKGNMKNDAWKSYCELIYGTQCLPGESEEEGWTPQLQQLKEWPRFEPGIFSKWSNSSSHCAKYLVIKSLILCSPNTYGCILGIPQIFWEDPRILVHIDHIWVPLLLVYMNTAELQDHKCLSMILQQETVVYIHPVHVICGNLNSLFIS